MEVAIKWEVRQRRLADPEEAAKVKAEDYTKQYSQDDLQQMIRNVKNADH